MIIHHIRKVFFLLSVFSCAIYAGCCSAETYDFNDDDRQYLIEGQIGDEMLLITETNDSILIVIDEVTKDFIEDYCIACLCENRNQFEYVRIEDYSGFSLYMKKNRSGLEYGLNIWLDSASIGYSLKQEYSQWRTSFDGVNDRVEVELLDRFIFDGNGFQDVVQIRAYDSLSNLNSELIYDNEAGLLKLGLPSRNMTYRRVQIQ